MMKKYLVIFISAICFLLFVAPIEAMASGCCEGGDPCGNFAPCESPACTGISATSEPTGNNCGIKVTATVTGPCCCTDCQQGICTVCKPTVGYGFAQVSHTCDLCDGNSMCNNGACPASGTGVYEKTYSPGFFGEMELCSDGECTTVSGLDFDETIEEKCNGIDDNCDGILLPCEEDLDGDSKADCPNCCSGDDGNCSGGCNNTAPPNSSIDVAEGAVVLKPHTDFIIHSRLPIEFKRMYISSLSRDDLPFGPGWTHNFDFHLQESSITSGGYKIIFQGSDGKYHHYYRYSTDRIKSTTADGMKMWAASEQIGSTLYTNLYHLERRH